MAYLNQKDFYIEVSKGNIAKHSRVNKHGLNPNIDTGTAPEDIIYQGGIWVPPTTARVHDVVSSSANDTSAGTGMRTLTIQGLDGSYNFASETVTLNGTTPVSTINSYVIIDYAAGLTNGSGGANAGTITLTAQTDATVTTTIPIGFGQNQFAIYQIRNGYKGYLNKVYASMNQNTAGSTCIVYLMTKTDTGGWLVRRTVHLNNAGNNSEALEIRPPLQLQGKQLVKLQVFSVSNNNTSVAGGFDLTLVQD